MNQKEWVSYFKAAYGRDPEPQEFSKALNKGEFTIERSQDLSSGNIGQASQQATPYFHESSDAKILKKDIQKTEDGLVALFAELGLQTYLQEINKKSIPLDNRLSNIVEANKDLYRLKKSYNSVVVRGRICLSCGYELGNQDRYCSNCGSDSQALEQAAAENVQVCSLCETKQDRGHHYCACCGLQF